MTFFLDSFAIKLNFIVSKKKLDLFVLNIGDMKISLHP